MSIITNPKDIELYALKTLRSRLKLEMKGLKHSKGSTFAIVKKKFGWKGNKEKILSLLENEIKAQEATLIPKEEILSRIKGEE